MIAGVTGGKTLPQEIADQIVDRTDGVPLFIEELTKAVVESGLAHETPAIDFTTICWAVACVTPAVDRQRSQRLEILPILSRTFYPSASGSVLSPSAVRSRGLASAPFLELLFCNLTKLGVGRDYRTDTRSLRAPFVGYTLSDPIPIGWTLARPSLRFPLLFFAAQPDQGRLSRTP